MRPSKYHVRSHGLEVIDSKVSGVPLLVYIQKRSSVEHLVSENKHASFIGHRCIMRADVIEVDDLEPIELDHLATHYVAATHQRDISTLVPVCAHYVFIRELITKITGAGFSIIEPLRPVAYQVASRVTEVLNSKNKPVLMSFYASSDSPEMIKVLSLLGLAVNKPFRI